MIATEAPYTSALSHCAGQVWFEDGTCVEATLGEIQHAHTMRTFIEEIAAGHPPDVARAQEILSHVAAAEARG